MLRRASIVIVTLLLTACSPSATETAPSENEPAPSAEAAPPPIPNPLEIGSQDARDDLYCAGLIFAAHPEPMNAPVPVEHAQILRIHGFALGLSLEGASKLIAEGVALPVQTGDVGAAWGDLAYDEYEAGSPRIPVETCLERARAAAAAYANQ